VGSYDSRRIGHIQTGRWPEASESGWSLVGGNPPLLFPATFPFHRNMPGIKARFSRFYLKECASLFVQLDQPGTGIGGGGGSPGGAGGCHQRQPLNIMNAKTTVRKSRDSRVLFIAPPQLSGCITSTYSPVGSTICGFAPLHGPELFITEIRVDQAQGPL